MKQRLVLKLYQLNYHIQAPKLIEIIQLQIACNVLNPDTVDVDFHNAKMMSTLTKVLEDVLLKPTSDNEVHPMKAELKRRYRDAFLEADELGAFGGVAKPAK